MPSPTTANLALPLIPDDTPDWGAEFRASVQIIDDELAAKRGTGDPNGVVAGLFRGQFYFNNSDESVYVCVDEGDAASAVWRCVHWKKEVKIHAGSVASIPAGWQLADGTNGTYDLRSRFLLGANADDAGTAKSTYTGTALQSGGARAATSSSDGAVVAGVTGDTALTAAQNGPHTHTVTALNTSGSPTLAGGADYTVPGTALALTTSSSGSGDPHNHTVPAIAAHTHSTNLDPPFFVLCFIMRPQV